MRVVIVQHGLPGASTFLDRKIRGLVEAGVHVDVVCTSETKSPVRRVHDPALRGRVHGSWPTSPRALVTVLFPIAVLYCLIGNPHGTYSYLRKSWTHLGLQSLIRLYLDSVIIALRPDIIHFEFGTVAVGRMHLGVALSARTLVSFRGYDLNFVGLDDPSYYDDVWQQADAIHFLGNDLKERAKRRGYRAAVPYRLIPPAVDVERFRQRDRSEEPVGSRRPLRILSVGRLTWKKGYEYGLEAVAKLVKEGVSCEYRIVGDGEYADCVAFAARQLEVDSCVTMLGRLRPDEVRSQLEWADVFLHPAVSEGFCNAVIEAQAMELPIVCSDADGLSENVVDGQTGFIGPRRDPEALKTYLHRLSANVGLRRSMGTAAREHAEKNFRIEDQITAFKRWYEDLYTDQKARVS